MLDRDIPRQTQFQRSSAEGHAVKIFYNRQIRYVYVTNLPAIHSLDLASNFSRYDTIRYIYVRPKGSG